MDVSSSSVGHFSLYLRQAPEGIIRQAEIISSGDLQIRLLQIFALASQQLENTYGAEKAELLANRFWKAIDNEQQVVNELTKFNRFTGYIISFIEPLIELQNRFINTVSNPSATKEQIEAITLRNIYEKFKQTITPLQFSDIQMDNAARTGFKQKMNETLDILVDSLVELPPDDLFNIYSDIHQHLPATHFEGYREVFEESYAKSKLRVHVASQIEDGGTWEFIHGELVYELCKSLVLRKKYELVEYIIANKFIVKDTDAYKSSTIIFLLRVYLTFHQFPAAIKLVNTIENEKDRNDYFHEIFEALPKLTYDNNIEHINKLLKIVNSDQRQLDLIKLFEELANFCGNQIKVVNPYVQKYAYFSYEVVVPLAEAPSSKNFYNSYWHEVKLKLSKEKKIEDLELDPRFKGVSLDFFEFQIKLELFLQSTARWITILISDLTRENNIIENPETIERIKSYTMLRFNLERLFPIKIDNTLSAKDNEELLQSKTDEEKKELIQSKLVGFLKKIDLEDLEQLEKEMKECNLAKFNNYEFVISKTILLKKIYFKLHEGEDISNESSMRETYESQINELYQDYCLLLLKYQIYDEKDQILLSHGAPNFRDSIYRFSTNGDLIDGVVKKVMLLITGGNATYNISVIVSELVDNYLGRELHHDAIKVVNDFMGQSEVSQRVSKKSIETKKHSKESKEEKEFRKQIEFSEQIVSSNIEIELKRQYEARRRAFLRIFKRLLRPDVYQARELEIVKTIDEPYAVIRATALIQLLERLIPAGSVHNSQSKSRFEKLKAAVAGKKKSPLHQI